MSDDFLSPKQNPYKQFDTHKCDECKAICDDCGKQFCLDDPEESSVKEADICLCEKCRLKGY